MNAPLDINDRKSHAPTVICRITSVIVCFRKQLVLNIYRIGRNLAFRVKIADDRFFYIANTISIITVIVHTQAQVVVPVCWIPVAELYLDIFVAQRIVRARIILHICTVVIFRRNSVQTVTRQRKCLCFVCAQNHRKNRHGRP